MKCTNYYMVWYGSYGHSKIFQIFFKDFSNSNIFTHFLIFSKI
jgi:hypothetical protein